MTSILPKNNSTRRQSSASFAIIAVLSVVALLFAACGGTSSASSSKSSNSQTTTSNATNKDKAAQAASFTAYKNCLAKYGLSLPNFSGKHPGFAGSSGFRRFSSGFARSRGTFFSNPKYKTALSACADLRPKTGFFGGFPGGRGGGGFSSTAQNKAFQNCLQVNGLSLSDLRLSSKTKSAISSQDRKIISECLSLVHKSLASVTTTIKGS